MIEVYDLSLKFDKESVIQALEFQNVDPKRIRQIYDKLTMDFVNLKLYTYLDNDGEVYINCLGFDDKVLVTNKNLLLKNGYISKEQLEDSYNE